MVVIKCPYCSHAETKVVDKRDTDEDAIVRRRRECLKCEKRFTTYEHVELDDIWVVKKDGKREKFDRNKVINGIAKACEKLPVENERIGKAVTEIETTLRRHDGNEVTSKEIGEMVMTRLKKLDKVAYIRFASIYREFTDIDTFKEELERLLASKK